MKKQFRHGDLFLEEVQSIPQGAKIKKTKGVLLEGEVTGHAHRLIMKETTDFVTYEKNGTLFLQVITPTIPLEHEEHKTIEIPAGTYEITRQREFDPYEGIRDVQD